MRTQYQNLSDGRLSARESGIRNARYIFADGIQNPRLWDLGIQVQLKKKSKISLQSGIKNPSFNDKDWNPEYTTWNVESKTVLDSLACRGLI